MIQRRVDNTIDFYRTWEDYQQGFGIFESNMWLGLDKIHCLTIPLDLANCWLPCPPLMMRQLNQYTIISKLETKTLATNCTYEVTIVVLAIVVMH